MISVVSRTMVPMVIRSHFASRSLVIAAVKSVSVGLCAVVATIFMPIASACMVAPASTSLPKSVS